MTPPRKQIILAAHFPGVNNTTVWSDPNSEQPDRVRELSAPRPDRRAREVRLLLPRRGPPAARAARTHPRPRRRRPPRHHRDPRRAGRGHDPPRPGRHAQRDLPRGLRARPPGGHPRPPVGRPCGVERRHLERRLHRRELPARRLPRLRRSLRAGRGVHPHRQGAVGLVGRRTRSSPTRRRAASSATAPPAAFAHHGKHFDIAGQLQRAAQPAASPGHHPGRRQRPRARARRGDRRRDLQPALHARGRPGVLHRRQGAARPATDARATT